MKKTILTSIFLTLAIWSMGQVDQYKVRARLFLQTDSFLIWRGDTIDFNELVSLQQLIDSMNNYANQNLSSTKAGNNVAVNITGGNGTSFSVADADSSVTNEIELPTQTGNNGKFLNTNGTSPSWATALTAEVDGSTSNEIQNLSKSKTGNNITVNISGGTGTTFSVADADSSVTNEIELPTQTGNNGKFLNTNGTSPSWATALTAEVDGSTSNEIQNLTKSKTGNNVTVDISGGTGTTFSVADADSSVINEIELPTQTGNNGKFLSTNGTSPSWATALTAEVDGSTTNEIQNISYTASTRAVAISSGTGFTFPTFSTSGTDAGLVTGGSGISAKFLRGDNSWQTVLTSEVDGSTTNEIQNLSKSKTGNNVTVNISGGTGTTFSVADADSSVTNEIELPLQTGNSGKFLSTNGTSPSWATALTAEVDGSTTNEIQNLSYNPATAEVGISGGTGYTISNFATSGTSPGLVAGSNGNTTYFLRGDNTWQPEADGSTTNELENWGTDYVHNKDSTLRGRGTTASPLYIDTTKIATQYDISGIASPWTSDANGVTYTAGNVGIGIASQANNGLYVKDSTGTYNYAAIIDNPHATGSGLKVKAKGSTNSYHIATFQGNSTDIFNFEADGSILMRETAGDLPDSNYGALYGSTDGKIYYRNDGGGVYDLTLGASGSATPPGGSSGDIQYNNSGAFGGFGDWNGSTLSIPGELSISSSFTTTSAQPVGISSSGYISMYNISAPSTPGSTTGRLYMDSSDDKLYFKNSANTYDLTASASGMTNPMTTTGDIIYSSSGSTPSRLGIGTSNQVLMVSGGLPSWQNAASGFADPMTTRGDIIYRNSSNTTARLGIGTSNQVLTSNGTDISWATPSSGFSDPMTTRGDLIFRNSSNTTARLGAGSAGQVLTSNGTDISWATPGAGHDAVTLGTANGLSLSGQQLSLGLSSSSTTGALSSTDWSTFNGKMTNPMTTEGDMVVGGTSGIPGRLAKGYSYQVLGISGGSIGWRDIDTQLFSDISYSYGYIAPSDNLFVWPYGSSSGYKVAAEYITTGFVHGIGFCSTANYYCGMYDNVIIVTNSAYSVTFASSGLFDGITYIIVNQADSAVTTSTYTQISGSTTTNVLANTSVTVAYASGTWYQIH